MPPRIPEFGEAVQHNQKFPLTVDNTVKTNPIGSNKLMFPYLSQLYSASFLPSNFSSNKLHFFGTTDFNARS
jgi:hypothetical protein